MKEFGIKAENLSKSFRIYHEKRNSIYDVLTSFYRKKVNYENLQVLKDVSFSLKRGEMLAILGKNGVEEVLELDLNDQELADYKNSISHIKKGIEELKSQNIL